MADFENEDKMITADVKNVSEALEVDKKTNQQEKIVG